MFPTEPVLIACKSVSIYSGMYMNAKPFSFPTPFLSTLQHAFLLRTHCMLPSYLVTNGELMVHENYPKLNRSVSKALAGCSLGHQSREGHIKKRTRQVPWLPHFCITDYFISFPFSAFIPKLIYWVLQNTFYMTALCSATLIALIIPSFQERDSLLST